MVSGTRDKQMKAIHTYIYTHTWTYKYRQKAYQTDGSFTETFDADFRRIVSTHQYCTLDAESMTNHVWDKASSFSTGSHIKTLETPAHQQLQLGRQTTTNLFELLNKHQERENPVTDKQTNRLAPAIALHSSWYQYISMTHRNSDKSVSDLDEWHGNCRALHFATQFVTDLVYVLVWDDKDQDISIIDSHIQITQRNLTYIIPYIHQSALNSSTDTYLNLQSYQCQSWTFCTEWQRTDASCPAAYSSQHQT